MGQTHDNTGGMCLFFLSSEIKVKHSSFFEYSRRTAGNVIIFFFRTEATINEDIIAAMATYVLNENLQPLNVRHSVKCQ